MDIKIDDKLINYLEELSQITLLPDEKERLKGDLSEILGGMAKLGEINVKNNNQVVDNVNAFREDEEKLSLDSELILKNAPVKNEETFIVPKVI